VVIGTKVEGMMEDPSSPEGGIPIRLEVAALDAVANNATRNVRVRAIAPNPSQRLRPGMFVKVRVPVDEPRPFVSVPVTAVRRAAYADQVFVIETKDEPGAQGAPEPKMRARQRFVRLGPTVGDRVIVLDGLAEGETIAASGSFKLRDGVLVRPGEAPAPGAAAGGPPRDGAAR
jgi:membrane fusion protein (multidrug efflux system)